ncbi:MAG: hypothetical protein WC867_05330 [Candidatus Pacearchaeota archaeon]|jgi:hypothetical protein
MKNKPKVKEEIIKEDPNKKSKENLIDLEEDQEFVDLDDIVINSNPNFRNRVSLGIKPIIPNQDAIQNLEIDLASVPTNNTNDNNVQYGLKDNYANSSKPDAYQESKYDSSYPKTIQSPSINQSSTIGIGNSSQSNIFRQNNDPTVNSNYPETIDRTPSYDPINEKPKRNIW